MTRDRVLILIVDLLRELDAEAMPTGEPAESVWIGRQQVADDLRRIIRAHRVDILP